MMTYELRWIATLLVAALLVAPTAHADPNANDTLDITDYGTKKGHAVCATLAKFPTTTGVQGMIQAVMQDSGFDARKSAQVVGFSVANYCPQFQPLLTQFAEQRATIPPQRPPRGP